MDSQPSLVALLLALAFANGTDDVIQAIAAIVGSGLANYRTAIAWGTAWTILGACTASWLATAPLRSEALGTSHPARSMQHLSRGGDAGDSKAWSAFR